MELVAVVGYVLSRVFADEEHLAHMGFRLSVAFETVLIPHLAFADLEKK